MTVTRSIITVIAGVVLGGCGAGPAGSTPGTAGLGGSSASGAVAEPAVAAPTASLHASGGSAAFAEGSPTSCDSDADCPKGTACVPDNKNTTSESTSKSCVPVADPPPPKFCQSDADCSPDEQCIDAAVDDLKYICAPIPCQSDAECPQSTVCLGSTNGSFDKAFCFAVPPPPPPPQPCQTDADCKEGTCFLQNSPTGEDGSGVCVASK